jgi:predicted hydrocarbon binding protein
MHTDFKRSLESVQATEPSLLKRREIEARIAVPLIQAFAERMGREQALAVATKVIQALACAAGREMAKKLGANDMVAFTKVVREVWAQDKALEMTMFEETDLKLSFNVTRCAYAELYEKLGMKEFGHCLSCSRDTGFAEGFNPRLKLQRTQTLMQGAPHCDFRFSLE